MRYTSADTEYGAVALGVFSMAGIPVICSRQHWWNQDNTIYCTLIGCLPDRKGSGHSMSSCCSITFSKDRKMTVKWDHVSQLRRQGTPQKLNAEVYYTLAPYYNGFSVISTCVDLVKPDSLNIASRLIREASLFHLRAGHERRNYISTQRTLTDVRPD